MAKGTIDRTDWELVESVRAGSQDAFTVLVGRYQRQIAHLAYLSLGNRVDAEDITQEAFFRLYQTIDRLTERDSVFPWIYRIAANLCIDESRRRSLRRVFSLDFLVDEGSSGEWIADDSSGPGKQLEEAEEREHILRGLARLSASERIVLIMRDFEELSYHEIAMILGVNDSTVKTRLFRARKHLSHILRPQE